MMNLPITVRSLRSLFVVACCLGAFSLVGADESEPPAAVPDIGAKLKLVPLTENATIWIDSTNKVIAVKGRICLREGTLEMFACPRGTKEHESIVAVDCRAREVHAALLAIGLEPGSPMEYRPVFKPATGPILEVRVVWKEDGKIQSVPAQNWIRHIATKEPMSYDWVFAGSSFWHDLDTGNQIYLADSGDLICVSNFPSATLDLPVPSPEQNAELWFDAFTERIPPIGTDVYVLLREKK